MKIGDIPFVNQLIETVEEANTKLEKHYKDKDYEAFNKSKKLILQLHKKINELLK